jgi:hypothetical protein
MEWNHILDIQPDNNSLIIQIDPPYKRHYNIGMRKYDSPISFEELLKWNKENDWPIPDFWWIYAKDFPFPNKDVGLYD